MAFRSQDWPDHISTFTFNSLKCSVANCLLSFTIHCQPKEDRHPKVFLLTSIALGLLTWGLDPRSAPFLIFFGKNSLFSEISSWQLHIFSGPRCWAVCGRTHLWFFFPDMREEWFMFSPSLSKMKVPFIWWWQFWWFIRFYMVDRSFLL